MAILTTDTSWNVMVCGKKRGRDGQKKKKKKKKNKRGRGLFRVPEGRPYSFNRPNPFK